jgi:hypothetical protein
MQINQTNNNQGDVVNRPASVFLVMFSDDPANEGLSVESVHATRAGAEATLAGRVTVRVEELPLL